MTCLFCWKEVDEKESIRTFWNQSIEEEYDGPVCFDCKQKHLVYSSEFEVDHISDDAIIPAWASHTDF